MAVLYILITGVIAGIGMSRRGRIEAKPGAKPCLAIFKTFSASRITMLVSPSITELILHPDCTITTHLLNPTHN